MAKILLIDDNVFFRDVLRQMLEKDGYTVVVAGNGVEGMRLFREEQPQVVITDIVMPEKDGIELIRELRACDADVGIIAVSGGNLGFHPERSLEFAESTGANCTLRKPIQKHDVMAAVEALLAR